MISTEDYQAAINTVNVYSELLQSIIDDLEHEGIDQEIFSDETAELIRSVGKLVKELKDRVAENFDMAIRSRKLDA
jgi:hypothetical protein